MSDEKMRAEFEGWIAERIANNGVRHWLKRKPSEDLIDNGGPYQMVWVEAAWQGWQASRVALVVDLPFEFVNGMMRADGVISSIEAAGVRVKP